MPRYDTSGDQPTSQEARSEQHGWALRARPLWAGTLAVLVLALAVFAFLYARSPLIYDTDSYYHLAVAREYARHGITGQLEWVRFGVLAEQFGDKELLFHLFLTPFVSWFEPSVGGRLALGLLGALILTLVGHLSLRAIGSWGLLIPFWLLLSSTELAWRLVRLRPELVSLLLLLLALWAAGGRRYRLLGLLAAGYALAYTAIHAFVGIFALVFLLLGWVRGRWEWRLLLYPILGAGVGLLVHPHFPDNLAVWWFQSVEYLRFKGSLDVGNEIRPNFTDVVLMVNLGWLLGLALLWRAAGEERPRRDEDDLSLVFGVAATVFAVLYLLMARFSLYALPLVTLWLLFELRRRGKGLSPWLRLPGRRRLHLGVAWALCLLVSLPVARSELARYRQRTSPGPERERLADLEAMARALPAGAEVAAPWQSTPLYMFFAPQARYLNVLDPVFLEADTLRAAAAREIFDGSEPDPALVAAGILRSSYIVFSTVTEDPRLARRLLADPRATLLRGGIHAVFRLRSPAQSPFVLQWKIAPQGTRVPPTEASDLGDWPEYPLLEDPALRALEGYVNVHRFAPPTDCATLVHELVVDRERDLAFELAPAGPSSLWVDGVLVVGVNDSPGAILGRGVLVPLRLIAGEHRLTVRTCPDADSKRTGFYLVLRQME